MIKPEKDRNVTKKLESNTFRHRNCWIPLMKPKKIEISVTKNMENYEFRHNYYGFFSMKLKKIEISVTKSTENCEFRHKMTVTPRKNWKR